LEGRKRSKGRQQAERVLLDTHSENVERAAAEIGAGIDAKQKAAFQMAAKYHDYGKADVRYQAWLLGGDRMAAQYAPKPVAKSGLPLVRWLPELPGGFRHELLSLMFAERASGVDAELRDLILHLVASHHGRCRPFAPFVADENAECVSCGGISIGKREREEFSPCSVDSGISERFWILTRHYGWWGLAYLEALFRLADWKASENEGTEAGQ
jgi:CRISPR-associated endonuclease/helicase Cas3